MIRTAVVIFFLFTTVYADLKQDVYHLYQSKKYDEACSLGMRHFQGNRKDTEFVSLYAFSCLKSDFIDRLAVPISILKHSEEARANAAYLSVILMQKKLLYHALIDGYDLSGFKLPSTDYVLSKVFDLYAADKLPKERTVFEYQDPAKNGITYKLYIADQGGVKKMVIEEYYDTILAHRHIYW